MSDSEYQRGFLVSTEWLQSHLADENLRIFDVTGSMDCNHVNRGRERHYDVHHIPGAAYLDVASTRGEMADPEGAFPFTWPSAQRFEETMRRAGVNQDSLVVLYGGPNPEAPGTGATWATRAWWLMHHFGVDCRILDGGWLKWQRENRRVSTTPHDYPQGDFTVLPGWERGCATKNEVLSAINTDDICVVDSLSAASFRGEVDRNYGVFGSRKGHISGALNLDFELLIDHNTGCYRRPEELKNLFEQAGVNLKNPVITYCGGGIGATSTGFALKLIGCEDVAIYDASLMEWANDPNLPMTDLTKMSKAKC